jgi:hypothetical protein
MLQILMVLLITFLIACGNNNERNKEDVELQNIVLLPTDEDTTPSNVPFYPYIDYINEQLQYIDTTPLAIEKIVTLDGKTIDSTFATKQELRKAALSFTAYNPNLPANRIHFKETSFRDLTINRITFSISALHNDVPLQQVDILMDPDKQKVKNLVIRQQYETPDSSNSVHMVWVDKMHMQVSESISLRKGQSYTRVTRWVWDKPIE